MGGFWERLRCVELRERGVLLFDEEFGLRWEEERSD